jgi:hypothetical protein
VGIGPYKPDNQSEPAGEETDAEREIARHGERRGQVARQIARLSGK